MLKEENVPVSVLKYIISQDASYFLPHERYTLPMLVHPHILYYETNRLICELTPLGKIIKLHLYCFFQ
jgi:hypothetical protein